MNQMTNDLGGDLAEIGARLSQAIYRDHHRRVRRRALARTTAIVSASVCALSGTALAGGELTGAVDLGGGHSAVPVNRTPVPANPRLPYQYKLAGVHQHNGGAKGPIYIESSAPLSSLSRRQLAADRRACTSTPMTVKGATVWIFDATCARAADSRAATSTHTVGQQADR